MFVVWYAPLYLQTLFPSSFPISDSSIRKSSVSSRKSSCVFGTGGIV